MPIACNPWLEANQREGKVSVKQSQALSLLLSFFVSPRHQMPFFHSLFDPTFLFLSSVAQSAFGSYMSPSCRAGMGAQAQPWGAVDEGNPQDNWSGHGQLRTQQPSLFYPLLPWQTFALQLSSEASQQLTPTLLSGNANQSLHSLEL